MSACHESLRLPTERCAYHYHLRLHCGFMEISLPWSATHSHITFIYSSSWARYSARLSKDPVIGGTEIGIPRHDDETALKEGFEMWQDSIPGRTIKSIRPCFSSLESRADPVVLNNWPHASHRAFEARRRHLEGVLVVK
jgi:hypothetical protein